MANGFQGPPAADFYSQLSGLGDVIAANRTAQAKRDAFAQATMPGPDGQIDFGKAVLGLAQVDPPAAALLAQRQNHQDSLKQQGIDNARADKRDTTSQYFQNENLKISKANLANNSEGPEETASQRANAAASYGIKPDTPEFKSYVLTGKLPEGDTSIVNQSVQRKAIAEANGLKPDHPAYNSFILTGKMPREDAQPLTATDKKAILEADEMVQSTQGAISNLQKAKELSTKAFAGPLADKRGYAASFLGESSDTGKAGIATTDLNNLVTTNALAQLKAIFGGNPTEGERGILLSIQGSANQPDAVRQKIYDRAIELASKRLQFNKQRADELRGGQFYKAKTGPQAAAQPSQGNGGDAMLQHAREAIAQGAPREAVLQRLQQAGVDVSGL